MNAVKELLTLAVYALVVVVVVVGGVVVIARYDPANTPHSAATTACNWQLDHLRGKPLADSVVAVRWCGEHGVELVWRTSLNERP